MGSLVTLLPLPEVEMLAHFRLHWCLVCLLSSIWLLVFKRKWAWTAVLAAGIHAFPFVAFSMGQGKPVSPFTLFSANVHRPNRSVDKVMAAIKEANPDVIILIETDHWWVEQAHQALTQHYPFECAIPRSDNFGMMVLSRLAGDINHLELGSADIPSIIMRLEHDQKPLTLIATHPLPPISHHTTRLRNQQLDDLAQYVAGIDTPVIVAGDLNTTIFAHSYARLVSNAKLRHAGLGSGTYATWPSYLGIMGIPIDHVLVSEPLRGSHFRVHRNIDSDHLPISVSIGLTNQP
ncbi:MAG: endonuclease/exonuclease/phosphatase family protein [Acidobacteria bacterium]|nr:endonuclease/exonuclease/phosphatase family protein [Acidobacteriota bacterium]